MAKIIDLIRNEGSYFVQWFAVLDEMPTFQFERINGGRQLLAECDGFYKVYKYEQPGPTWKAFGGAKFEIPMKEGDPIKASGQWWHVQPKEIGGNPLQNLGIATLETLDKCYCFEGADVLKTKFDEWLASNEPASDYYKYDKRKR